MDFIEMRAPAVPRSKSSRALGRSLEGGAYTRCEMWSA